MTSAQTNGGSSLHESFYQMLGSPKHVLAPMVAQSDLAFRLMCETLYDVDLSYTQMIHAYNFVESNGETFRKHHLDVYPHSLLRGVLSGNFNTDHILPSKAQLNALQGLSKSDIDASRRRILEALHKSGQEPFNTKPTVVQIAAHDPKVATEAALLLIERASSLKKSSISVADESNISPIAAIDLNLGEYAIIYDDILLSTPWLEFSFSSNTGCPQAIARKGKYGAFLHDEYPELAYSVLRSLRAALPADIGVTAKIRLPPTTADADAGKLGPNAEIPPTPEQRIRRLIDCGVDLITVHGRTRFENKVAVSAARWEAIEQCVTEARSYSGDKAFPVFANGGIEIFDDVSDCLKRTGASGVMSSESLLENPGLFTNKHGSEPQTAKQMLQRQLNYAEMYLDYATLFPPLPGSLGAQGGSFNVIRSHLFKFLHRYFEENSDLRWSLGDNAFNSIKEARELISTLKCRYDSLDEDQLMEKSSSSIHSSWYRRHRNANSQKASAEIINISIEEKKRLAKERIQKMRQQRVKRKIRLS